MKWLLIILLIPMVAFSQKRTPVQWYQRGDSLFVVGLADPKIGTFVKTNAIQNVVQDAISHVAPPSTDSNVYAKKSFVQSGLDRKQTAGIYLVPSDTNSLRTAVNGKQPAGSYLVPSDTNALRSGLNGKQPSGTYLTPADTGALVYSRTRNDELVALKLNISAVKSASYMDSNRVATLDKAQTVSGVRTFSGFDTFTGANSGTATIGAGDSVQVSVTNLTTSGIAVVSYKATRLAADTAATWSIWASGKLSLYGKFAKVISYWIMKK